ncbi:MAG: site-2 protease family protein [Oscillospiraceae bacterium]|nr:site-2 protease family protein [Oscillospiraceae bacterium]
MNTFLSIIVAIIIFCIIIIVHEFGHFFVAKLCGVKVSEFAIGMGPVVFKKQGKETLFTLRLLPIGGFCSMGEDEDSDDPNSFRKKPVPAKMAVIVAGAFMNIVLGFLVIFISFIIDGKGVSSTIVYFADDAVSPSYGLQLNDTIVKINGLRIFAANDITYQLSSDEDGIVDFVVKRDGELVELNGVHFPMVYDEETGKQTLIYDFKVRAEKITIANIFPYSFKSAIYYGRVVLMSLLDLVMGKYGINDLQGPVGIVSTIGTTVSNAGFDWDFILSMAALITINIGIFNLLPIPALDGGRFVFLVIEAIRRKPMKAETEGLVHFVGFALLMVLVVVVTFNDIKNLFV